MAAVVTHRSTVNMWHCDEMGHLNVRHYVGKADAATIQMANMLGLSPRALTDSGRLLRTRDHHIRFSRELHAGTGLYVQTSVLAVAEASIRLCHEVRRSIDLSLSATLTGDLELVDKASGTAVPFPTECRSRAGEFLQPLPDYAAPRSLSLTPSAQVPTLARADELGLVEISRVVVEASQCDGGGRMMAANYLGTISDGIANLFLQDWGKGGSDPQKRRIGGAALEYRLLYHRPCTVGTLLVVRSCMVDVGDKTVRHAHWMFDAETGEEVASAQALAVFIDMEERRAIAVPAEARRHFQSLLRSELA